MIEIGRVDSFFCTNCGCLLLAQVRITPNSRIVRSRLYCADCYYKLKQQIQSLNTRLDHLRDKRVMSKEW